MSLAKVLALLGAIVMFGAIVQGFVQGDFTQEGNTLLAMPWGRVSLIDIYVGIAVFACWVVFRECSFWRSLLWIIGLIVGGNLTTCLYVFVALHKSGDNWKRFFWGRRADPIS